MTPRTRLRCLALLAWVVTLCYASIAFIAIDPTVTLLAVGMACIMALVGVLLTLCTP